MTATHSQGTPTPDSRSSSEKIMDKVERSVKSEDHPMGDKEPSGPFIVVALSYLAVGLIVTLIIAAMIFLT